MSRQKGSRPRPVPERRRYHEQFSGRRRPRSVVAPASGEPLAVAPPTRRRLWAAVLFSTLVLVFAYTGVITAIVEQDEGDTDAARLAVALAVALVPVAFTILARVSRTPHAFRRVLLASPLAVSGYLALGSLIKEPTSSLVLAFGVAGAFVLRSDPPGRPAPRILAVSVTALITLLLYVLSPGTAVVAAPFLPFPALMAGDRIAAARPAI
ncbi:MAG TPA: hypothetical protein VFY15_02235 [Acidimicrobiia bacterium]|nr:hypothetical protein [Acidimicrobiia bacterium]